MFWLFTSCNSLHNQDRENFQQPRKFSHALCSQFLQPAILGNCLSDPAAAATKVTSVVSNYVWPHRWPPTTLLCPWDSPDKNTGVGCHFLLQCMKVKVRSCPTLRLLATSWTAAYQASLSMGFSRQEYWSGVPLPSPYLILITINSSHFLLN